MRFRSAISAQSKSKLPAIDVFGGYSYLRFDAKTLGFTDSLNLNGANVEVALPDLYEGLGAALDVSGHYHDTVGRIQLHDWAAVHVRVEGHAVLWAWIVRASARTRLRQPGTTQMEPSYLSNAVAFGGGVDFPLTGRLSVRAIQADYLITGAFNETQHNIRLSTGLVYRFGKQE